MMYCESVIGRRESALKDATTATDDEGAQRHGGGDAVANVASRCPFSFRSIGNGVGPTPPSLFDAGASILTWGRHIGALASALANASPTKQRTMLGENLYPLVEQLEPDTTAKVTGKLLEMDQTKALHLLESLDALKAKVAEAMGVLRNMS
ncbi:polyadenylate-binding 8-like [Olea europaea subsp. europaea]|uniref:Polyadenylate-binding 8-like n=1 Tax=Olea europaea subsp. europaea TaxID=158383 RepID=A0A8S0TXT0_OLEEU|nr:polyadenylate-binding 8-like [Olea europaea subsp. europaea]